MASLSRLDPQGFWTGRNISGDGHKGLPTEVDVLFVLKGKVVSLRMAIRLSA